MWGVSLMKETAGSVGSGLVGLYQSLALRFLCCLQDRLLDLASLDSKAGRRNQETPSPEQKQKLPESPREMLPEEVRGLGS